MKKSEKKKRKQKKTSVPFTSPTLTPEEIAYIKQLYADAQNPPSPAVGNAVIKVPAYSGDKKRTSISIYTEHWNRWIGFKERYNQHNGTDLLALALDEFMAKYETSEE